MTDRELLHRIERSAGQRAGYKQLVRELGLGGGRERRMLVEQLDRMTARGELVKSDRDHWALPLAASRNNLVAGRLDVHRDGFGFVRPEARQASGDDDIFIPPNEMNGAMQGDQVLVEQAPPAPTAATAGASPGFSAAATPPWLASSIMRFMTMRRETRWYPSMSA